MTRASRSSSSAGRRTRRVRAPMACSARSCSLNAPCRASTPTRGLAAAVTRSPYPPPSPSGEGTTRVSRDTSLPASGREQLLLGDLGDLQAAHGLPEPGRNLGEDFRLVVVAGRGHDRLGHLERVLGLEDPGPHEVAV